MIDDHLMPSGEPAPLPSRRDRNLESLGGSTRLELGLGGVMRVLRRRGLLLIGIFVISAGLIYIGTSQLQKRYASVAWIRVTDDSQNLFIKSGQSVDLTKEQRAVIQTLESPRLSGSLQRTLGKQFPNVSSVAATGLEASPLIRIDSEATTPELARRAANAAADFVVGDRQKTTRDKIASRAKVENDSATALEAQVNDLAAQIAQLPVGNAKLPALQAKLDSAKSELTSVSTAAASDTTDSKTADGGLELYEDAIKPTDPAFPKPTSWGLIGGFAMLLISVGVVYGREELVGRFRSGDSSESRRAGARVLGVLPSAAGVLPRGVVTGAGATVDEVGLQLVHLLGRSKPNVVLLCGVDGPAPEATARRIAQAIAESGARVVFAACRGVSDSGNVDEFEAPVPRARLSVVHEQQTGGRLRVLDDGIGVNELTVARARTVLRRLTEQCEYVVIAAPSPTVEPSSLVLAELADATVMIGQHGVTKLRDAERAGTRLRRVGGAVLGVLVDPEKPGPAGAAHVARATGVSAG
ncbi:MAG: hypothetical protein ABJC79_05030 [Acidimicrobiia bacterium]